MKFILLFILICSCGKNPSRNSGTDKNQSNLSTAESSLMDRDGDGVTDLEESKKGTNPLIADIPTFKGEFFIEMKVDIELYNKSSMEFKGLSWLVKNDKISFSWLPNKLVSPKGAMYLESLLKNYALNTNFRRTSFSFSDYNEGIYSFSSPVFFEDTVFEISKELLNNEKEGFTVNRAKVLALANLSVNSKRYKFFRDPVFDLYYKSRSREGLIFIESKRIEGTYQFNGDNKIYFNFDSRNEKLIYDSLLNGGGGLFVKLRDFVIYDTNEKYSDILRNVLSKSLPLSISVVGDEVKKSSFETLYVGTNGKSANLSTILKTAFQDDFMMTSSSVDQIRSYSNRQRTYGEDGTNEHLRWYIGTNGVSNNLFTYQFRAGDGVIAAYISDRRIERKPIYTFRSSITNSSSTYKTNKMPPETKNVKIRVVPVSFLMPVYDYDQISRPHCGRGSWQTNRVIYSVSKIGWSNQLRRFFDEALNQYSLTLKNNSQTLITGKILDLARQGFINLNYPNGDEFADISFKPIVLSEIKGGISNIEVEIDFEPESFYFDVGVVRESGRQCVQEPDHDRGNHGGGGVNGGIRSNLKHGENLSGRNEEGVLRTSADNNISADFHIFSY